MFAAILQEEFKKCRQDKGFWLVIVLPLLLALMVYMYMGLSFRKEWLLSLNHFNWSELLNMAGPFWAMVIGPILVTTVTTFINAVEYRENCWKYIVALPLRRSHIYLAKLLTALLLFTISALLTLVFLYLTSLVMGLPGSVPWSRLVSIIFCPYLASWALLAIAFWLANKFGNPVIPLGIGFVSLIAGFYLAQYNGIAKLIPNVYPLIALPLEGGAPLQGVLSGLLMAVVFSWLGMIEFVRRDIL